MSPGDLMRLMSRLRDRLQSERNGDLPAQARAYRRLRDRLSHVQESDQRKDRGFSDRAHDAILYDEEQH